MNEQSGSRSQGTEHEPHPGDRVEVRNRFDGSWARGFEVVEVVEEQSARPGFRVRRQSDGVVLPALFVGDAVRFA